MIVWQRMRLGRSSAIAASIAFDDLAGIEPVAFSVCQPRRLVPRDHILAARQIGRAVDGDAVVVPQHDQPPELQMPGKPDRLVVDALHQIAVAGDHEGTVVDQLVAVDGVQMPLGDRHSDRHGNALPERAGGDLDSRQLEILRVPGAGRAKLAEALDVVDRRPRVAGEIEQGVDQHRPVPSRQHEAVAVGPCGVARIELQVPCEQRRRSVGHAHRHSRMPAVGGLDRVHRKSANGVGEAALGRLHRRSTRRGSRRPKDSSRWHAPFVR